MLRISAGSGLYGLAGLSPHSQLLVNGNVLSIYRPLLGVHKERLRATCEELRVAWVEDSSNYSRQFQRNVIREALSKINIEFLKDMLARMQKHRTKITAMGNA